MLRRVVWGLSTGVATATVLSLLDRVDFGEAGCLFDLLAHFPRQLIVAALVIVLAASVMRLWRPAQLAAATAAVNLIIILTGPAFAVPEPPPANAVLVRVASANVHASPEALAKLAAMAQSYGADLISVYEAPALSDDQFSMLFPGMSANAIRTSSDGRGLSKKMLTITRAPTTGIVVASPGGRSNRAVLRYRLAVGGRAVQIVAAHPVSPDSPAGMRDRNQLLLTLAEGLDEAEPFLVMGDFNTSPWARIYRQTPGTRAGDPTLEVTFPASALLLGIPIDHIKFGGGLRVTEHHVGPDIGSDHLPVFATFALPGI